MSSQSVEDISGRDLETIRLPLHETSDPNDEMRRITGEDVGNLPIVISDARSSDTSSPSGILVVGTRSDVDTNSREDVSYDVIGDVWELRQRNILANSTVSAVPAVEPTEPSVGADESEQSFEFSDEMPQPRPNRSVLRRGSGLFELLTYYIWS